MKDNEFFSLQEQRRFWKTQSNIYGGKNLTAKNY